MIRETISAYMTKTDYDQFKVMQSEGRTREFTTTTFPLMKDDVELRMEQVQK